MHKLTTNQADKIRQYAMCRDSLDELRRTLTNTWLANDLGLSVSLVAQVIARRAYGSPVDIELPPNFEKKLEELYNTFERIREEYPK